MDIEPGSYDDQLINGPTGRFLRYLLVRSYARPLRDAAAVLEGTAAGPEAKVLHEALSTLTVEQRQAISALVKDALEGSIHNFLHALSHDQDQIRLLFDGEDVAEHSDGLHGDLFIWLDHFPDADADV